MELSEVIAIIIAPFFIGYLLGSIPFGLILTRLAGGGDIRNIGSGNIGATNVLRTGRKGLAAATLLLDMGKGFLAVLIFILYYHAVPLKEGEDFFNALDKIFALIAVMVSTNCAALGALLGHCYPLWLKFKGGKGVATMLGISFALDWRIGLVSALAWVAGVAITRISSLGGMASAVAAAIAGWAIVFIPPGNQYLTAVTLTLMALLVIWKHRANIARLGAGTEPKIGQR